MRYLLITCLLIAAGPLFGQAQKGDVILQQGDTTILQHLKGGRVTKEHFYLNGKRIFSRWWTYQDNGSFNWYQTISKSRWAKKNGPAIHYYETGQIWFTTVFRHDNKVGPCATYYPTGVVESICTRHVLKGKWDGLVNHYYPNGRVKTKLIFKNGALDQILAYRDEMGDDLPIGTFSKGNGDWIIYFGKKPAMITTYKHGRRIRTKFLTNEASEQVVKKISATKH